MVVGNITTLWGSWVPGHTHMTSVDGVGNASGGVELLKARMELAIVRRRLKPTREWLHERRACC